MPVPYWQAAPEDHCSRWPPQMLHIGKTACPCGCGTPLGSPCGKYGASPIALCNWLSNVGPIAKLWNFFYLAESAKLKPLENARSVCGEFGSHSATLGRVPSVYMTGWSRKKSGAKNPFCAGLCACALSQRRCCPTSQARKARPLWFRLDERRHARASA